MLTRIPFALLATALACSVFAAPAHALRARVFVSKTGADVGACSFSAPCQSLGYALSAVEPGGEITILDSGGYNPITITQGVTITVPSGVEAGIAIPSGGTGITINAVPGAVIRLRGLTLQGTSQAYYGIQASGPFALMEIVDCAAHDFLIAGIYIVSGASPPASIVISHTVVTGGTSNGNGIVVGAFGNTIAAFDDLLIDQNETGISLSAENGGSFEAMISNSNIDNNTYAGVVVGSPSSGQGQTSAVLRNVTVNQTPNAVALEYNSAVYFSQVTFANVNGFALTGGVVFLDGTSTSSAQSDGTSHLTPVIGGSIGTWTVQ